MNRWKASLGLGTGESISDPNDPRRCIIKSLSLVGAFFYLLYSLCLDRDLLTLILDHRWPTRYNHRLFYARFPRSSQNQTFCDQGRCHVSHESDFCCPTRGSLWAQVCSAGQAKGHSRWQRPGNDWQFPSQYHRQNDTFENLCS